MTESDATVEKVYSQQASRILAVLVRLFGTHNLALAEDVLQDAFRKALVAWQADGVPANPAGWIISAAKNQAIDAIRGQRTQRRFSADLADHLESGWTRSYTVEQEFDETRIKDHQLRMIFMCTGAELPPENRIPLILRSLCGFSIPAICRALYLPEATVKKRLLRTRERLEGHKFEFPSADRLPQVMDTVHTVIYLLFNEGFHSSEPTDDAAPMNLSLCHEAVHLARLLCDEPRVVNRDTLGLLALMQLHLARSRARIDADGRNVPIDRQDRSRWDAETIALAGRLITLATTAPSGASGRFLIEARIARQHCIAPTFAATDWPAIVALYDELVAVTGSPIVELHRAVAIGYAGDPRGAMARVERLRTDERLRASHVPLAVLAHLSAMLGDAPAARRYAEQSQRLGGTPHEHRSMLEQVERLLEHRSAR
ncbi:MAG TPA: sigma-70 family RNA polymerase sigma factor [Polyangia bacterium]|jgi:RNA polymerase sigma-70 factor (ECF subfamily)|nr:sigma-70 family RNA polymerase sigma factor [Polyangia bacterium]